MQPWKYRLMESVERDRATHVYALVALVMESVERDRATHMYALVALVGRWHIANILLPVTTDEACDPCINSEMPYHTSVAPPPPHPKSSM